MIIDTGTAVLVVVQLLIGVVVFAGVPWAFSVQSKLAKIETSLCSLNRDVVAKKMDSATVHDEMFGRIHKVERTIDRCPSCRDAAVSLDGSD